jgi:hypothetical protein
VQYTPDQKTNPAGEEMKRFILEQSDDEFYTSHSGLALARLCITRYSDLSRVTGRKMNHNGNLISNTDILRSYLGLLCLGKSDYEAITAMRNDEYFKHSLGITNVPFAERLRQRLDEEEENYLSIAQKCSVAMLTIRKRQEYEEKTYFFTKVVQITERSIDKHGQVLLVPNITVDGWWTNLALPEKKIISLYRNHALSEQFHSEFKTDFDLERLPSGKFATNKLVMALGAFAYNILRFIGQLGLLGEKSPVRHPGKKRRLKTVIQKLIYLAARLIRSGNRLRLRFGRHCPAYPAFTGVYGKLLASS